MNGGQGFKLFKPMLVCCGLVFVAGVVTLALFYQRVESKHWPSVTGVVTTSALKLDFHKPPHAPYYRPFVSYSYNVGGIPRGNTRITFALDGTPRFRKEEGFAWLNQKYPVGKQVPVFYDPADPDRAVLEPGADGLLFLALCLISQGILMCVGLWLLHQREKRRSDARTGSRSALTNR